MKTDKSLERESFNRIDDLYDDTTLTEFQTQARHILRRAVVTYLVMFLGAGLIMSALGVDPLANNVLMPKALLLFVGMATIIALLNNLITNWPEQKQNWLGLMWRSWSHLSLFKRD